MSSTTDCRQRDRRIQLHRYLARTRVEGPGLRACLWVQGCSRRCPGCFMEAAWSFRGGKTVAADHLLTRILADPDLEGVTFLGGEPFEQAEALAALGRGVQRAGLSVMTFTGYTREILAGAGRADWRALLAVTDLLVDGPYDQTRPDSRRPWVGSTNQRLHDLTGRYRDLLATLPQVPDRLEIRLDADGNLLVNGFATTSQIRGLLEGL